ncbi:MAG TPA: DUF3261 domain-containing protein [Verrucomicrobiae bacterium]|nr:DUF3261 domain-containing protein [Verrucomicrobiae bacterium]
MARFAALAALAILLGACATPSPRLPPEPFAALPPHTYGGSVSAEQRLTLSRNGASTTLQCFVDIAPERIQLVGAGALGQRVLSLTWDGDGLRTEGDARASEQALRDLQLVTWPLAALQRAAAGTTWRIEELRPGIRQVWRGDAAYAEIHYASDSPWSGRSWLANLEYRYTLDIESRLSR